MTDSASDMQAGKFGGKELPAGTRIEEFVIERVLGSGGFGITYLAKDTSLNRQVVIKENLPGQFAHRDTSSLMVRPGPGREDEANFRWSLENFSKEAALLASLRHPGVVPVLRRFEALGTAYFVMPFVDGVTLDQLIESRRAKGRAFSEDELRGLLEHVLAALGHLHDRGIYHRDIKPGNVLVTDDGVPVLIDFGSARQRLSERSMTVVESAGYTPFEQLQSRGNVGPWSDLYSLSGTLVKAITGETPPKANDRIRKDPHVKLAEREDLAGRYSAALLVSIDRAFEVEEENRWQDAGEWLAALREPTVANAAAPVPSPPPTEWLPEPASPELAGLPGGAGKRKRMGEASMFGWVLLGLVALVAVGGLVLSGTSGKKERGEGGASSAVSNDSAAENQRQQEAAEAEAARVAEEQRARQEAAAEAARVAEEQRARQAAAAEEEPVAEEKRTRAAVGKRLDVALGGGVKIELCGIPAGTFTMGGSGWGEKPHQVSLTKPFWLGRIEVTQAQWEAVMGNNPSRFKGKDLPVEMVSWEDCQTFLAKLTQKAPGQPFRLPTEAEWEFACRAGSNGDYCYGDGEGKLGEYAWYYGNAGGTAHPVGGKKPNAWGLYDMHGNVWEWCADWDGEYPATAVTDPLGPPSGSRRVIRGGSWYDVAFSCRAAGRFSVSPGYGSNYIGFRIARSSVP